MKTTLLVLVRWLSCLTIIAVASGPASARAQSPADLDAASLEDLMKITVTTASRRAEGIADAPAQVEVVTAGQDRVVLLMDGRISVGFDLRIGR